MATPTKTTTVRHDVPGDARLVAYCVPTAAAGGLDTSALRSFMSERLPPHSVQGWVLR